jgi:hypothetical protein
LFTLSSLPIHPFVPRLQPTMAATPVPAGVESAVRCPKCHASTLVSTEPLRLRPHSGTLSVFMVCLQCEHVFERDIPKQDP